MNTHPAVAPATGPDRAAAARALRERLASLSPAVLDIVDESHLHAGHAGAREGGHFALRMQAAAFNGKTTMQRHRLVYQALGDLRALGVHALRLQTEPTESC